MSIKKVMESWKYYFILLLGIGVSNVGAWVYHIALNLIVLDMTESPLAVTGLYILKPLATLFTNGWSGSLIDRLNKKHLMVGLNIFQAIFIAFLPLLSSLWGIYCFVFVINMASSMFHPTSMTYMTKLIPKGQRKKFNSLRSLIDSGAFLIGPAIAGLLFMIGTPTYAIYINAIALFLSGLLISIMPNVEKEGFTKAAQEKLSFNLMRKDWKLVLDFSRQSVYIMFIYFLFSAVTVMTWGVDSLEAAFAKEVLHLSDRDYGFLVSIAGAGVLVGSIVNTLFVKKLAISWLIGIGSIILSLGYIIFSFSNGFLMAAIGCFILSFSLAFANTGFYTFYQNNIPVDVMGRIGSVYGLLEAFFIIIIMSACGIMAELLSIQFVVISGALIMLLLSITLFIFNIQPSKVKFYTVSTVNTKGM
jgi:MFS family permease